MVIFNTHFGQLGWLGWDILKAHKLNVSIFRRVNFFAIIKISYALDNGQTDKTANENHLSVCRTN